MRMKLCPKCMILKELNNFYNNKSSKDGKGNYCKNCFSQFYSIPGKKKWRQLNKEKHAATNRKSLKKNRIKNRAKLNAKAAKERGLRRKQTPKWLSSLQKEHILLFYEAAHNLSNELGIKFHVDHIIPIGGKEVSGLHVPWNLQIIKAEDNYKKSNKIK